MQYIDYKWLEHPEQYYPEPKTIINVMKWHVSLERLIGRKNKELDTDSYEDGYRLRCMSDFKSSREIDDLYLRDEIFIKSLGYKNVALCEVCMLIGRDLWYRRRNGTAACVEDELLDTIDIRDLKKWAEIYDVPLSVETGGEINAAYEYTFGKIPDFMAAYIDAVEKGSD